MALDTDVLVAPICAVTFTSTVTTRHLFLLSFLVYPVTLISFELQSYSDARVLQLVTT